MRIRWTNLLILVLVGVIVIVAVGNSEGLTRVISACRDVLSGRSRNPTVVDLAALGFIALCLIGVVRLLATALNRDR